MEWEGVTYRMYQEFGPEYNTPDGGWWFKILTWDKRYPRVGGGGSQCDECDVNEFAKVEGPYRTEALTSEALQAKLDKWRG